MLRNLIHLCTGHWGGSGIETYTRVLQEIEAFQRNSHSEDHIFRYFMSLRSANYDSLNLAGSTTSPQHAPLPLDLSRVVQNAAIMLRSSWTVLCLDNSISPCAQQRKDELEVAANNVEELYRIIDSKGELLNYFKRLATERAQALVDPTLSQPSDTNTSTDISVRPSVLDSLGPERPSTPPAMNKHTLSAASGNGQRRRRLSLLFWTTLEFVLSKRLHWQK